MTDVLVKVIRITCEQLQRSLIIVNLPVIDALLIENVFIRLSMEMRTCSRPHLADSKMFFRVVTKINEMDCISSIEEYLHHC